MTFLVTHAPSKRTRVSSEFRFIAEQWFPGADLEARIENLRIRRFPVIWCYAILTFSLRDGTLPSDVNYDREVPVRIAECFTTVTYLFYELK